MFDSITRRVEPYLGESIRIILVIFMAVAVVIFLGHAWLSITFPYPLDYGEGPLLDQAVRLASGETIYRPDISSSPFTIANYPPLYVALLAPLVSAIGPALWIGRLISVLAALAAAVCLGLISYTLSQERFVGWLTAACFLATPYVVHWSGLMRIDLLALAFAAAALLLLVRWPQARWSLIAAGLLLVSAAYTRQSYALAAPLAAFAWLWAKDRRRAIQLAGLVAGLGIGLFLLLNIVTSGGFLFNIITANTNEFGLERLERHMQGLWDYGWPLLLMGAVLLLAGWRGGWQPWTLLAPFLVGGFVSALTIGKIGSNVNYLIELGAALALAAGGLLLWSRSKPWAQLLIGLLLVIQFGLYLQTTMVDFVEGRLTARRGDLGLIGVLDRSIAAAGGPVLADEYMGLLPANGQPVTIQPFEVTQMARDGNWDQTPFLEELEQQQFSLILIHHYPFSSVHEERWTPEMLQAIEANYKPSGTYGGTVVYEPQQGHSVLPIMISGAAGSIPASDVRVAPPVRLTESPNVMQPDISLNPANPDVLTVMATTTSKRDCYLGDCLVNATLFLSMDGGTTWEEQAPFTRSQNGTLEGQAEFMPDGALVVTAVRDGTIAMKQVSAEGGYRLGSVSQTEVTRAQVFARPWLTIDHETGQVLISFDSQFMSRALLGPSFISLQDGSTKWSPTYSADLRVSVSDIQRLSISPINDIQVLPGRGNQIVLLWTWTPQFLEWPLGIWAAVSNDGGRTFSEPSEIAQTWGGIHAAAHDGVYYLIFRGGDERAASLMVARSEDGGTSWRATPVSANVPLTADYDHAPAISVAADGTIDVLFYAQRDLSCTFDNESWWRSLRAGWDDTCTYDVYYTFSKDDGQHFATPIQLNEVPISGARFLKFNGRSTPGSHLAITSSDQFAYASWIDAERLGGDLMFTRISR